jgi:hypothetical protein
MAQLPKKHTKTSTRTFFKKNGFWYAILSGYGVKDKHVNIMVLLFFFFAFCNFILFAATNISFYGLSKLLAVVLALSFGFLLWANKFLAITSSFWQPRMVLLLLVPMLTCSIFALNFCIPLGERETEFAVKIKRNGAYELEHIDGRDFSISEARVYNLKESSVIGDRGYSPEIVLIKERLGIFGMWIVDEGYAVYPAD